MIILAPSGLMLCNRRLEGNGRRFVVKGGREREWGRRSWKWFKLAHI